jgi:hypothetical protein
MRLVIAIIGLLGALPAQVVQSTPIVGSIGTDESVTFPQFQPENCSNGVARGKRLQGTFAIGEGRERKIVHEVWMQVDSCHLQGATALCPNTETPTPYDMFKSQIHSVTATKLGSEADGITRPCGSIRRIKLEVPEY